MQNWELLKSLSIVNSEWLKVFNNSYKLPDEKTINDYYVIERSNFVLIVATDGKKVALVQQYRPATERYYWSLPAGYIDPGESPESAGQRELLEETGLHANSCRLIGELHPLPGYIKSFAYVVLCTDLSGQLFTNDSTEIASLDFIDWEVIDRMIINGGICEMQAVAALLLTSLILNRK